jgi:hypothetical protein
MPSLIEIATNMKQHARQHGATYRALLRGLNLQLSFTRLNGAPTWTLYADREATYPSEAEIKVLRSAFHIPPEAEQSSEIHAVHLRWPA